MDIKIRITICRLLNKVNNHKDYAIQIGVMDATHFRNLNTYDSSRWKEGCKKKRGKIE